MKKQKKVPPAAAQAAPESPSSPVEAAPESHDAPQAEGPIIVGIGASAGGLEAMQQLLGTMPADTGLAFIHIQHLDPTRKTVLPEILQNVTRMKVVETADDTPIAPNTVYISPPDRDVATVNGRLQLIEPTDARARRLPIDFFFRALARDVGDRAIGIVLSGTGTDGTLGIRAIKGAGGLTIAQDTRSARYDGMPRSAINTHLVDFVVSPGDIARVLLEYVKHPYLKTDERAPPTTAEQMDRVFQLLREQTGHDFSQYKPNTIHRRIERRMAVHQFKRLDAYLSHLQRSPAEVDSLFKDLLIGVTNFFRDPESFVVLEEKVVPKLFESSTGSGQIRIWVPGCSTGEEAYSLAILFAEHMDKTLESRKIVTFATDIDPSSIDVARTAVYPDSITADVTAERLARFFTKEDGAYRIGKRVREMAIFAVQDVLKDPPFSKLDLISCRNLLIYLGPELQRRLMQLFHAVLNPGGHLFLGASETVGDAAELFNQVDKKWKVYEKRIVPTHPLIGVTVLHALNEGPTQPRKTVEQVLETTHPAEIVEHAERLLLDSYAPTSVVLNERYDILYAHGRSGKYMDLPTGEPQLNLLRMTRDDMLRELRTALHKAQKERAEVVRERVSIRDEAGNRRFVRLRVKPFRGARPSQSLLLVSFEEVQTAVQQGESAGAGSDDPRVHELEGELASMRESLQSTVEEVETSNEELRSTNEELQSANEELQSTNEELETSKEELQSVNEELLTVNAELQKKLEELSQANNDLSNLLNSTEIGTIFLDNELRIKRFTPAMGKLINLIPTDVGRPVWDIATQILYDDLADHAREVLRTLMFQESEVRTKDNRCYLRRILPYRTVDNVIDGVVITFVNITEVREAQRMIEAMLTYANALVNAMRQPVALLNKEGRIVQVNQLFYSTFHTHREDTLGANIFDMDGGRWGRSTVRPSLEAVLAGGPPIDGFILEQDIPGISPRNLRLYARRTAFGMKAIAGEEELTVLTIEDAGAAGA